MSLCLLTITDNKKTCGFLKNHDSDRSPATLISNVSTCPLSTLGVLWPGSKLWQWSLDGEAKLQIFVLCSPEAVYSSLSTIRLNYYVSAVFFPVFLHYFRLATSTIHTKSQFLYLIFFTQICA